MSKMKHTVVSLFSGAMGLDAGLHKTGAFNILAAVEKEPAFCETIRANVKAGNLARDMKVYERDVATFDPQELMADLGLKPGELDLLVGGPPCQSFSTAGRRGTVQDTRGTLLWDFLRFVEVLQPRYFLMENVRGLLSAALKHRKLAERPEKGGAPLEEDEQPGSVLARFSKDLRAIDPSYRLDCFEVNAVNYGAPQLRERVLFIGNRFNREVDFPSPTHGPDMLREADLFAQEALRPWATLRDALDTIDDPGEEIMDFSPRKKSFLKLVAEGSNWRSLPEEKQRESMGKAFLAKGGRSGWWRRLSFDLPCPTLVTMPNHASTSLCHPTEVRALTVKEYAAIQEFPPHWEFAGTTSKKYAQIGNAVPVRLGEVAGEVLSDELTRVARASDAGLAHPPKPFRKIYIQSHVRTRKWFDGKAASIWKDGQTARNPTYGESKTKRKVSGVS